jgi:hypothetical protein
MGENWFQMGLLDRLDLPDAATSKRPMMSRAQLTSTAILIRTHLLIIDMFHKRRNPHAIARSVGVRSSIKGDSGAHPKHTINTLISRSIDPSDISSGCGSGNNTNVYLRGF